MITAYNRSGEKIRLTNERRDLGHGIQIKVIYFDGSIGWEHILDIFE